MEQKRIKVRLTENSPYSDYGYYKKGDIGYIDGYVNDNAVIILENGKFVKADLRWIELVEQKHIDKIEPKFKVGDWVIDNNIKTPFLITDTSNGKYDVVSIYENDLAFSFNEVERFYHLWTIQDAKDGDVVADKSDGAIGIFQSIGHHPDGGSYNDPSYCFLHCRYDDGFFYADFEDGNTIDSDYLVPATKEQRDTLIKAMADAGYTFDFEKKELKKIEQKPIKVPKFKAGDFIQFNGMGHTRYTVKEVCGLSHYINTCNKRMDMSYTDANFELVEQKPWSEDDREYMKSILDILNGTRALAPSEIECHKDWLKSLKDRYTWRPSGEQMVVLNDIIINGHLSNANERILKGLQEQLKKLREE